MIRVIVSYNNKLQQDCISFEDDLAAQAYALRVKEEPNVYSVKILGGVK